MTHTLLALLSVLAAPGPIQEPAAAPPPRAALLFKSGQAYLEREVALAPETAAVRLRLPDGIHGTMWLGSGTHQLQRAVAAQAEEPVQQPVQALADVLRMAVGQTVTLEVAAGDGTATFDGRIVSILEGPAVVPAGGIPVIGAPAAVAVDLTHGTQVIPLQRILGVTLPPAAQRSWTYTAAVKRPVLEVALAPAGRPGRLTLASMASGLSWAPSYVLELGPGGKARLTGKAVVVNDLEDLVETRLRLVVGFPHFQFAGVRDPLLPDVMLAQFRNMLAGAEADAPRLGVPGVMAQTLRAAELGYAAEPISGPATPLEAEPSEDLYVYDLGAVSLRRGERAYLPLLSQEVEYAHRFDWELPDRVDRYDRFQPPEEVEAAPVWHVLRLRNAAQAPWTTAPILVTGDAGPVAQSRLDYTAAGAEASVRLTRAMDLVGQILEVRADSERAERQAVRLFGNDYERVRVKGTLELANHSRRAASMRVVKHFSGDLVNAEGDPKAQGEATGLGEVNASRVLTWEFELAAGATWKASFEYSVLLRR